MVEFAMLAPAFIVMLLGVLQVGMGLQSYNAMRGASAEIARYAMVQYARGNRLNNTELQEYAEDAGSGAPYLLAADRLEATVTTAATQRVTGATELTLTVTYQIPSILSSMGLDGPEIDYSRPIFLTQ
jgi:Flp pilus assembly protein TadG